MGFDERLGTLKESYRQAAKNLRGTYGLQSDPALALYDKMTPSDFNEITMRFGLTEAIGLVKDLEIKRMKNAHQ